MGGAFDVVTFPHPHTTSCVPPSVPYLGAYLSQLVIIEVGMPTFVQSPPEHVNYPKLLRVLVCDLWSMLPW